METDPSPRHVAAEGDATHAARLSLVVYGVCFAMVFPTIVTICYFVLAERFSAEVQQALYAILKPVQFGFPLVWTLCVLGQPVRPRLPKSPGMLLGVLFGLAVGTAALGVYYGGLNSTSLFVTAAAAGRDKLLGMGLDSTLEYVALGVFYALLHSFLEEYYWRWFVFGQLRRLLPVWPAILISALGFTAHHVIVLAHYFGWASWATWAFASAVTVGGVFWAWLYARTGSLLGPWLSHLLVDSIIFWIGYDLTSAALGQS